MSEDQANRAYIGVTYANLYEKPTFRSALVSQLLLWEQVQVEDRHGNFFYVTAEDGYQGWIDKKQLCFRAEENNRTHIIHAIHTWLFADRELTRPFLPLSFATRLPVISEWKKSVETQLPDGSRGWLNKDVLSTRRNPDRALLVEKAILFSGVPYVWGGRSGFGVDCSGYVQLLFHGLFGLSVRRDAHMQYAQARPLGREWQSAQPGDLYFNAHDGEHISHVAIALGGGKCIHARGMVRINSLQPGDEDFDEDLYRTFVEVRTFFESSGMSKNNL